MMTAMTTIASWKLVMLFVLVFFAGYAFATIDLSDDDEDDENEDEES